MSIDPTTAYVVLAFVIGGVLIPVMLHFKKNIWSGNDRRITAIEERMARLERNDEEHVGRHAELNQAISVKLSDTLRYIEVKVAENYVANPRFAQFEQSVMSAITAVHAKLDTLLMKNHESN